MFIYGVIDFKFSQVNGKACKLKYFLKYVGANNFMCTFALPFRRSLMKPCRRITVKEESFRYVW